MATGTQTGMRTGNGPAYTGTQGGKQSRNPSYEKALTAYKSLTPLQKKLAGIILGLIVIAAISFASYGKMTELVPLYDTKLSQTDIQQIQLKLTEMGIDSSLNETKDGILLPPQDKSRARISLANMGLPRRPLQYPEEPGMTPVTSADKERNDIIRLEADLTETIRQIDGVADAYVKIAVPKEDSYSNEENVRTASVMLSFKPGAILSPSQVKGIMHMIAFSVPKLEPKNVKVLDTHGFILNSPIDDATEDPVAMTFRQHDQKITLEKELQKRVQDLLDKAYGQGKTVVAVTATLDPSSKEKKTKLVGGPENSKGYVEIKSKTEHEKYNTATSEEKEPAVQMSLSKSSNPLEYDSIKRTSIIEPDITETRTVTPPGEITRLSASVLVDNLKDDQKAKIENIVKTAIGIDELRGDAITVASIPFYNPQIDEMRTEMLALHETRGKSGGREFYFITAAFSMGLIIPMLLIILKQQKFQKERSKLILATGGTATVNDISDLCTSKAGSTSTPCDTRVYPTEQLERFAAEKPTKLAELLRTTWLAEKAGN